MPYALIGLGVILLVLAALCIRNQKINGEIRQNGIEASAVVTRVKENVSADSSGMVSVRNSYYVTYRAQNGQEVEALLGSGKSFEFNIGKRAWDADLREGSQLRIKYLPEKPNFAIRIES